ncbi:MAG: RAD55 family ATPase [Thermodesulfobacteriota bacterium]
MKIIDFVEEMKPQHVILDAISACERMGGKEAAFDFLMRILNFFKERGITSILTNQTTGTKSQIEISGNGISSMVDTVIFLSYRPEEKEVNRMVQILKCRGSKHSNHIRKFIIKEDGFHILD